MRIASVNRRRLPLGFVLGLAGFVLWPLPANAQTGWTSVSQVSPSGEWAFVPDVATDPQGNAVAVWFLNDTATPSSRPIIRAARFNALTGVWSSAVDVSTLASGQFAFHPHVAIDASGNAVAVWLRSSDENEPGAIQAARWRASDNGWSAPVTLSSRGHDPDVVMDAAGNATAAWEDGYFPSLEPRIVAARYAPSTDTWTAPTTLIAGHYPDNDSTDGPADPVLAADSAGNVVVAWGRYQFTKGSSSTDIVQASRYSIVTGQWSEIATLSSASCRGCIFPSVAAAPSGDVVVMWADHSSTSGSIQAARLSAASGSWSATVNVAPVLVDPSFGSYAFPRLAADAAGNFTAVWSGLEFVVYSARYTAAEASWTGPVPVTPFGTSAIRPRVVVDSLGNATAIWISRPVSGETIRASRAAAGSSWGASIDLSAPNIDSFSADAAVDAAGNVTVVWERNFAVGNSIIESRRWQQGTGVPPGPPALSGSVSGLTISLLWSPSSAGGAPTSYIIEAGSGSGLSNLFNGNVGNRTSLSADVSPGTFHVRVRGVNNTGRSLPSNEVVLTTGGNPPGKPAVTSATAAGGTLTVSWTAGPGPAATSHRLDFYQGAVIVATLNVGATTSTAVSIPPGAQGTFGVQVTALNVGGTSPPSDVYTFSIGPACTPPASPIVSGGIVGGTATVGWPAVPGTMAYIISAGTTQGGIEYLAPTNIGLSRSMSAGGLPTGFSAWVRVIALNACHQESAPSEFLLQ